MTEEGQVVLLRFPQTDQTRGKLRPALVLRKLPGRFDDWLISMISSNLSQHIPQLDEIVRETDDDFTRSGLKQSSVIRVSRLAVVEHRVLLGSIGRISAHRLASIRAALARWLAP